MNAAPRTNAIDTLGVRELLAAAAVAIPVDRAMLEGEVVRRHVGLISQLAGRYAGRGADREDLIQVASVALVGAIRGFDHAKGEFAPFATATIRGEIKKYFRDACWVVRPPRRVQLLQANISAATERRLQLDACAPRHIDLAKDLGTGIIEIREALAARNCFSPVSLDQPQHVGGRPRGEALPVHESPSDADDSWMTVGPLCEQLDASERELLRLRFFENKSQREIGILVGISQMQVARRLAALLQTLREGAALINAA